MKYTFLSTLLFFTIIAKGNIVNAQFQDYLFFKDAIKNPDTVKKIFIVNQLEMNQIGVFKNVEEIKADWINIDSLPLDLFKLTGIKKLYLGNNKLKYIPKEISQLKKLEYLNLENNAFNVLPESFSQLTNLSYLNLLNSNLDRFPSQILSFSELENLIISGNFNNVPDELFNLINLKELNAPGCFYERKDYSKLAQLSNLEKLALHMNGLREIPIEVFELQKLRELYLYLNPIHRIPAAIGNLKKLEVLSISSVSFVPPEIKLCESLNGIMMQSGELSIESLENIFDIPALRILDLAGNKIVALPNKPIQAIKLNKLILNSNLLTVLPASFEKLDSLETLGLMNNTFSTFPIEICSMESLKDLDMDGNPIKTLPECLIELSNLKKISAESVIEFPTEILDKGIRVYINYDGISPEMKEMLKDYEIR